MRKALAILIALSVVLVAAPAAVAVPPEQVITVVGPFDTENPDGAAFVAELEALVHGRVQIEYQEMPLDPEDLMDLVTGEDPPDIIVSPQPGVLKELADYLMDLDGVVNENRLRKDFGDFLIDVASVDRKILGGPIAVALKSLVWYKPAAFTAASYAVPKSFAELLALTNQMVADGRTPWCNYIESGSATGWVGTDWVEDLLLGAEGGAVYDDWVDHGVLFVDPRVETAFERYQQMIDTPGYVFDRPDMLGKSFFANEPALVADECLMHRQGTFFGASLAPEDLDDLATFPFPAVNPDFSGATVGGGLHAAMVNDRPEVANLMRAMLGHRFGRAALADVPGWISPNLRFNPAHYSDERTKEWADQVRAAIDGDVFRFDASDAMPPVVGTGTFWAGIRDLVAGTKDIPDILMDIDASWP